MENQVSQLNTSFLIKWILVTCIAYILGFIFYFLLNLAFNVTLPDNQDVLFLGLVTGASVGYSQWLILRKYLPVNSFWGTAYLIGIGFLFTVDAILIKLGIEDAVLGNSFFFMNKHNFITLPILGNLFVGLLQLYLLKPFSTKAGWWITANPISWGLASSIILINIHSLFGFISSGILMGAITGFCLLWITKSKTYRERIAQ